MIIKDILLKSSQVLKKKAISSYEIDSELLLAKILKISREELLINLNKKIKKREEDSFNLLVKRRIKNEPIAYILNEKEFWNQKYYVNESVLIPRPDSEVLIEVSLKIIGNNKKFNILDIGTGSGCIILSILNERPNSYGIGIDISKKALKIANFNAKMQHIQNRVKFCNSNIDKFTTGKYDLIVSNPPYIEKHRLKYLDEDVKFYEPHLALNGGFGGCSVITKVIFGASGLIKKNGKLVLEIDNNQVNRTVRILKNYKFQNIKTFKDLNKKVRCIVSTKF